jgi:hypothetical protein
LVAISCFAGAAHAQGGVEVTTFDTGGVQYRTSMPMLESLLTYGQRLSDGYDVPIAGTARSGCFVATPWFEVDHGNGTGEHFPDFYATWQGVLFPQSTTNNQANVFNIRVEIKAPNGVITTKLKPVTTKDFSMVPIFFPTPGSIFEWGDFNNIALSANVVQLYDVHTLDMVRASVCDLAANATVKVRNLVIRTFPISPN